MKIAAFFSLLLLIVSCTNRPPEFKTGIWRGVIDLQGQQLPFTFNVATEGGQMRVLLNNGTEQLTLDEVTFRGDSVNMVLHIFDAVLRARVEGNALHGFYLKNYDASFKLPFNATFGDDFRFEKTREQSVADFSGKYNVQFISDAGDTTVSVGIFTQQGNHANGTFLTPQGDYRYLEGNVIGNKLFLSTFDGNHAFLFTAVHDVQNNLSGDYWSGKRAHEVWTGVRNEQAVMPNPENLTYLKPGYDRIDFHFPDMKGNLVSPSDERFKNKVVILQIFGTWCPNCMDETKFLAQWYKDNRERGVEILGLAYERKADFDYATARINKMKSKLGVDYDFVIAGINDKKKASETLPMLSRVIAFPTTIFVGKDGKVRHIRTGFEGPGTGMYYDVFKQRFNEMVNELLNESLSSSTK